MFIYRPIGLPLFECFYTHLGNRTYRCKIRKDQKANSSPEKRVILKECIK